MYHWEDAGNFYPLEFLFFLHLGCQHQGEGLSTVGVEDLAHQRGLLGQHLQTGRNPVHIIICDWLMNTKVYPLQIPGELYFCFYHKIKIHSRHFKWLKKNYIYVIEMSSIWFNSSLKYFFFLNHLILVWFILVNGLWAKHRDS